MIKWPMTLSAGLRHSPRGARARIAASLPRQAMRRSSSARAVGRAMAATALDRIPSDERAWGRRIESRRRKLQSDSAVIEPVFDPRPPAERGSWWGVYEPLGVHAATWLMSLPPVWCALLMRLVRELRPRRGLELGTGVGISGAYQAAALELNGEGTLTTLEGAADWAEIATRGFDDLGLSRVTTLVGPIEQTLSEAVDGGPFDYAFVDAEHTEEATLGHFESLLPHLTEGAVLVLDDTDFNRGTRRAWSSIRRHPRVSAAVTLRTMGVVTVSAPR